MLCTEGASFIAALSFSTVTDLAITWGTDQDDNQSGVKVPSVSRLADLLGGLSISELRDLGGAYMYVRKGEAIFIPAGWMYFQACTGYMLEPHPNKKKQEFLKSQDVDSRVGTAFLAPLLQMALLGVSCAVG